MWDSIGSGLLAGLAFLLVAGFVGGQFGGDDGMIFFGLMLLCGVMVACTHLIVTKLNALMGENKKETKENNDEH